MTIEDKALAYADRYEAKPMAETAIRAYIAGATEALASQWVSVKERMPEDGEWVIIHTVYGGIATAVWNERHECWDDDEGDDVQYEKGDVRHWLPIPAMPKKGGEQ